MTRASGLRPVKEHRRTKVEECEIPDNRMERRVLRSKYLALHNKINDDRDDLSRIESNNFNSLIKEVDDLHQQVRNPREQVADAEALLGITSTLVSSVKSHIQEGINVSDFVTCLISKYGEQSNRDSNTPDSQISIKWAEIGDSVAPIFKIFNGFNTMVGPMNIELKQRKQTNNRKKHTKPGEAACPKEFDDSQKEEKTDTDKNMATIFQILRIKKTVRLEHLILNRRSFGQTVENLFALSFLVKDGRVQIKLDDKGFHFVSPRNAPSANSVVSGDVAYTHFVFRFDFRDWKEMVGLVGEGDELMPDRGEVSDLQDGDTCQNEGMVLQRTPIRKICRNRGLVQSGDQGDQADVSYQRLGKRKVR